MNDDERQDSDFGSATSLSSDAGFFAESDSNEEEKQAQQKNSLSEGINFISRMPSLTLATKM